MIKIFMDCEMTGLTMQDNLISIGCIEEKTGRTFYAEIDDFDIDLCDDWVKSNVVSKLLYNDIDKPFINVDWDNATSKGSSCGVSYALRSWLETFHGKCIIVADVGHYDMCHIYELFGGAFGIPECLSPTYLELNMLIAKETDLHTAFDINRESLIETGDLGQKHNALYDAKVSREIYLKYSK